MTQFYFIISFIYIILFYTVSYKVIALVHETVFIYFYFTAFGFTLFKFIAHFTVLFYFIFKKKYFI